MHEAQTTKQPSQFRQLMAGPLGMVLGVVMLAAAGVVIWFFFHGTDAGDASANRNFMCSETNKPFNHRIEDGETYPIISPFTKRPTGFPAERCYWTKDGKAKLNPTLVILNTYLEKDGPTICPDCGKIVRPHNPPPPAEAMEEAKQANRQS